MHNLRDNSVLQYFSPTILSWEWISWLPFQMDLGVLDVCVNHRKWAHNSKITVFWCSVPWTLQVWKLMWTAVICYSCTCHEPNLVFLVWWSQACAMIGHMFNFFCHYTIVFHYRLLVIQLSWPCPIIFSIQCVILVPSSKSSQSGGQCYSAIPNGVVLECETLCGFM